MSAAVEDALDRPWLVLSNHFDVIKSMHTAVVPASGTLPSPGYYICIEDRYNNYRRILRHVSAVKKYNSSAEFITTEGWENGSPYGDYETTLELVRSYPCAIVLTHIDDV